MKKAKIFGNQKVEERIIDLLQKAGHPVSTGYIAFNLKVSWATARGLLLDMALRGNIAAIRTSNSFVFLPKDKKIN